MEKKAVPPLAALAAGRRMVNAARDNILLLFYNSADYDGLQLLRIVQRQKIVRSTYGGKFHHCPDLRSELF